MYPIMPTELKPHLDRLETELVRAYVRWINFRHLFAEGPERIELLNRVAPSFFGVLQEVMLDELVMVLARMTDKRRDTLNLQTLIRDLGAGTKPEFVAQMEDRLNRVTAAVEMIRDHRDRRVAHLKLKTAVTTDPEVSLGFSRQSITDALAQVGGFVNQIRKHFGEPYRVFEETTTERGDAGFLVSQLRKLPIANRD